MERLFIWNFQETSDRYWILHGIEMILYFEYPKIYTNLHFFVKCFVVYRLILVAWNWSEFNKHQYSFTLLVATHLICMIWIVLPISSNKLTQNVCIWNAKYNFRFGNLVESKLKPYNRMGNFCQLFICWFVTYFCPRLLLFLFCFGAFVFQFTQLN